MKAPKEILVYAFEETGGDQVLAIAETIDEIPDDVDGQQVATYTLKKVSRFKVKRSLEEK